jgi:hypothetical protein
MSEVSESEAHIVYLLDGSGSVSESEFRWGVCAKQVFCTGRVSFCELRCTMHGHDEVDPIPGRSHPCLCYAVETHKLPR